MSFFPACKPEISTIARRPLLFLLLSSSIGLAGCQKGESASDTAAQAAPAQKQASAKPEPAEPSKSLEKNEKKLEAAKIGEPAPAFTLPNLKGEQVSLSDFAGKIVVLEWFNPQCPFVKAAHRKGSLVDTAERLTKKGVVYLAINSGAEGKQGHGTEKNLAGQAELKMSHPILLDESGQVGRAYGATNTPHTFVIDSKGLLAYAGAVDNSPDGEGESPTGGTLIRHMEDAVTELLGGKTVSVAETKAYGCSVKYGS